MRSNTEAIPKSAEIRVRVRTEMAAFDRLPLALRRYLSIAPIQISALSVLEFLMQGASVEQAILAIDDTVEDLTLTRAR